MKSHQSVSVNSQWLRNGSKKVALGVILTPIQVNMRVKVEMIKKLQQIKFKS